MSTDPRHTSEWYDAREAARRRDGYECQECGADVGPRKDPDVKEWSVHHIDGDPENHDINNLVTLCPECHSAEHSHGVGAGRDVSEYLAAIRDHEPAATKEVADAVGVTRQGADYRLRRLEEQGKVRHKKAGNSLIWFVVDQTDDE